MSEREVQAQLHPHTGQVEVQPADQALTEILSFLPTYEAWKRAIRTLGVIAEGKDLPGALAKNTLEDIAGLMAPQPKLITWDHAGPDY